MKFIAIIICSFVLWLGSCKKIDKLTQFEMGFTERVIIPSSTGINLPFNLFTPDVKTNSETTFEGKNTRKDLIEKIKLTKLDLSLQAPTGSDFSFLKSIEIFISAAGMDEIRIAWKENIPANVGSLLELETSTTDLKEYIKKDQFKLRVSTVTDEVLTADHQIDVKSLFFVDAKIIGQ